MNTVIAGYARSPFTPARRGELARTRPDDIAAEVIDGLLKKSKLNPSLVEDLIVGTAFPEAEQGFNMARMITFLTDLPETGMQAIHDAAGRIAMGAGECFIAGGIESMTRIPMTGFNPMPNPRLLEEAPGAFTSMGITAENLAVKYGIDRTAQEAFAIESHARASAAREAGKFSDEIIEISAKSGVIDSDGCIRPGTEC